MSGGEDRENAKSIQSATAMAAMSAERKKNLSEERQEEHPERHGRQPARAMAAMSAERKKKI
jgi:hypothetical protein